MRVGTLTWRRGTAVFFVALLAMLVSAVAGQSQGYGFDALQADIERVAATLGDHIGVYVETAEGIIAVNERTVMSSASTIKVPILVEAIRQAEQGDLFWDELVLVTEKHVVTGSGTIRDMALPQTFTLRELAELMIVVSDNTATNMLMERTGFDEVNWTCIRMGCLDTILQNSIYTSMPQDRGPRNWTTARDMALIVKGAYEGDILSPAGKDEFLRIMRAANPARLSERRDPDIHADVIVGRKGGSTASPRVLHDVAIFTLDEQVVYAAVLTRDVEPAVATQTIAEIGKLIMDYMVANR